MPTAIPLRADVKRQRGEPIIAVVYARYSSHSQTDQSIEGQIAAARAYAASKGYTIVKEYCDRAQTGRNDNRDAFQQMLADTDKKTFDVIITWKIDRIGRNREDLAFNKHRCKKNGVKIEYVAETLSDTPESIILEAVLEGMAEYYSVQLSTNVKRGIRESAKKGLFHGGTIPLGFKINKETKRYEIDPGNAPVVQEIFKRYTEGQTEFEIIKWLNEKGVKTSRNQPFGKSSLLTILHNEKYVGIYRFEEIVVDDAIPPIVDRQTFEKVQEMMKVNQRAPSHRWTYMDFILTEKLFCGHCGEPMIGVSGVSRNGNKYGYYDCRNHRKKKCSKKPARKDWIENLIINETVKLLADDALLEFIADKTFEFYQSQQRSQTERKMLEKSLSDVNKAINNIMGAIEQGIYNATTKTRLDELEDQKSSIAAQIAEYDLAASTLNLTRDHILFFLEQFRDADMNDEGCRKRLIQTFINSVFLYDDGRIKIVYNYTGETNAVTLQDIDGAEASMVEFSHEPVVGGAELPENGAESGASVLLPQDVAHKTNHPSWVVLFCEILSWSQTPGRRQCDFAL